jgi:hypothetical protein
MKKSTKKMLKVNKPEEGLTVSIPTAGYTFERASTLDEKRLAVQMIQSGLLPNTWQQLISWMIQKHEKAVE